MSPVVPVLSPHAPPARTARLALGAMVSLYFFSFFLRASVPGTIFNELQIDLALTAAQVTGLSSAFFYVYAPMQFVAGVCADRFGGVRTLLSGALVMTIGAAWFPQSDSVVACYASRALTGFGASFLYLSIVKEIDVLFGPIRFPTVLGTVLGFGYAGGIAAMLPFERVVALTGWRWALRGAAIALAVVWVVAFIVLSRIGPKSGSPVRLSWKPLWRVFVHGPSRPLFLVGLINYPAYFVMQAGIGKKFLQDHVGLSSASGALFTTIMMGISASMMLSAGPLLRLTRHRRKPHLYVASSLILIASSLLLAGVLMRARGVWFLFCYAMLATSTASAPAGNALMKELHGCEVVGAAIAVFNGMAYIGVALLTQVIGLVLDGFSSAARISDRAVEYPPAAYATIFAILSCLSVVSLTATHFIRETHGYEPRA